LIKLDQFILENKTQQRLQVAGLSLNKPPQNALIAGLSLKETIYLSRFLVDRQTQKYAVIVGLCSQNI
jgi:hypothetical protein